MISQNKLLKTVNLSFLLQVLVPTNPKVIPKLVIICLTSLVINITLLIVNE